MAEPVQKTSIDMVADASSGAVKGAATGLALTGLAGFVAGALVFGGIPALAVAAGGAMFGPGVGALAGASAWLTTSAIPLALAGAAGGVGTAIGLEAAFAPVAAVGGLLGFVRGASKSEAQHAAYVAKTRDTQNSREAEIIAARNEAMQMGFAQGAEQGRKVGQQEGAQMVMTKLQEHAAQEHAKAAHAPAAHAHPHPQSHEHAQHDKPEKSFVAAENKRREQTVAAGQGHVMG